MPTTTLWVDPSSRRIAHFARRLQPTPRRVTLITAAGSASHDISHFVTREYHGDLPPEMLPQVCWLYRLVDDRIELAAAMD